MLLGIVDWGQSGVVHSTEHGVGVDALHPTGVLDTGGTLSPWSREMGDLCHCCCLLRWTVIPIDVVETVIKAKIKKRDLKALNEQLSRRVLLWFPKHLGNHFNGYRQGWRQWAQPFRRSGPRQRPRQSRQLSVCVRSCHVGAYPFKKVQYSSRGRPCLPKRWKGAGE